MTTLTQESQEHFSPLLTLPPHASAFECEDLALLLGAKKSTRASIYHHITSSSELQRRDGLHQTHYIHQSLKHQPILNTMHLFWFTASNPQIKHWHLCSNCDQMFEGVNVFTMRFMQCLFIYRNGPHSAWTFYSLYALILSMCERKSVFWYKISFLSRSHCSSN